MPEGVRIDGRTARAQRTRAAIVDAHLGLLARGDLKPTGERIAEAAGVSLRTLWTSFKDMETLFAAAGQRLIERQLDVFTPVDVGLPLTQRVDEFCRQRARMLEILAPAARAAVLYEPFSAALRRNRTIELGRVRDEIADLFANELAAAGADREALLNALLATSTFACWSVLRDQLGLSLDVAREVMTRTVGALLSV
ncbi:MAG TPA: TetR/AcrR family transcriptional regulator [Micromonosporaceae bacterium]|jgi:AcrR family transcriptional regulator|nr:TetR/AcrR family transcriptional regulator [Micromonosporaceae bacterium]